MQTYPLFEDDKGCPICVSDGISKGKRYGAYRIKPSGSLQRVKPVPESDMPYEALLSLLKYAIEHGWVPALDQR